MKAIHMSLPVVFSYRDIITCLNTNKAVQVPPHPVCSNLLILACKCVAFLEGYTFITPDHVRMATFCLHYKFVIKPSEGTYDSIIADVVAAVPARR